MLRGGGISGRWRAPAAGVLLAFIGLPCAAASLTVRVLDERGAPVPRVAVYATAAAGSAAPSAPAPATAVMDQVHNAFVPHMLVVAKGTSVLFPNSDSVSHHVYSFSDAKAFELGLYKGDVYPPVQFDKPGVVVLGCNIHDGMLGYVIVVDTPHFAMTDDRGAVRLDGLAPGEYAVDLWTPRARPSGLPPTSRVVVAESQSNETQLALRGKLAPDHEHTAPGLPWQRY